MATQMEGSSEGVDTVTVVPSMTYLAGWVPRNVENGYRSACAFSDSLTLRDLMIKGPVTAATPTPTENRLWVPKDDRGACKARIRRKHFTLVSWKMQRFLKMTSSLPYALSVKAPKPPPCEAAFVQCVQCYQGAVGNGAPC